MIRSAILSELKKQGLSRKALHRETGISWTIISRFLNRKADIGTTNLEKICKALGLVLTKKVVDIYQCDS